MGTSLAVAPFDSPDATRISEARKAFLHTFLPALVQREGLTTALDCGTGFGYFAGYLKDLGLQVTAFDVRQENVEVAKSRHPGITFLVQDMEDPAITNLGSFDIVVCCGLIYHLENPFRAIRSLYALTRKYLILEGMVAPSKSPSAVLYREPYSINQSRAFVALMPSERGLVQMLYYAGFANVYRPLHLPDHPDFQSHLKRKRARTMLVACKGTLDMPGFTRLPEPPDNLPRDPWATTLGKIFSVNSIKGIGEKALFALAPRMPPQMLSWLCARAYRLRPLAVWPGWVLKPPISPPLYKRVLWRLFSAHPKAKPLLVQLHKGLQIFLYPKVLNSAVPFYYGTHDPNELVLLERVVKSGQVFVDVGANMGLYSLFASRLVGETGTVLAVEPSAREYQRLLDHIALNRAHNIRARRVALAEREGTTHLLVATEEDSGLNSLGPFGLEGTHLERVEEVPTKRLDTLVAEEGLPRVDVIKIDVEGAEMRVLQGAQHTLQTFRPLLIVELSDRTLRMQGATSSQVRSFLRDAGYRLYRFDENSGLPTLWEEWPGFVWGENILAIPEEKGTL